MNANTQNNKKNNNISGIRGWLLIFIIFLVAQIPLIYFGTSTQINEVENSLPDIIGSPNWELSKTILWGAYSVVLALTITTIILLVKGRTAFPVRFAMATVWISWPLYRILLINWDAGIANIVPQIIGAMIWPIVWTIYLSNSYRVRNTYYSYQGLKTAS
jgi:hypothetical protein